MKLDPPPTMVGGYTPYFRLRFFNNLKRTYKWTPPTMVGGVQLHLLKSGKRQHTEKILFQTGSPLSHRREAVKMTHFSQKIFEISHIWKSQRIFWEKGQTPSFSLASRP